MRDNVTNQSKGYAFITFKDPGSATTAIETMNGFELADRTLKVSHVATKSEQPTADLDNDDLDHGGIRMGGTSRLQLMAKLAEGKNNIFVIKDCVTSDDSLCTTQTTK